MRRQKILLAALLALWVMTGCASLKPESSERPKRTYSKIILKSEDPSEENWQPPLWRLVVKYVIMSNSRLTDTKSISVMLVEKKEVIIGKIVSGGSFGDKEDSRYTRDRVTGKTRKIWGIMFKRWF